MRDLILQLSKSSIYSTKPSGVPIYYAERNTPEGCVIKEYPDGRKELVSFMTGTEKTVKARA
ncbi:hypothetical protein [Escherichia coli]|uniref:hypothetical protein n=1 Tax=Escherichia coli TaxID=562 RepID=UPI002271882A|nr:hypothetical protein [Escherichia coli]